MSNGIIHTSGQPSYWLVKASKRAINAETPISLKGIAIPDPRPQTVRLTVG